MTPSSTSLARAAIAAALITACAKHDATPADTAAPTNASATPATSSTPADSAANSGPPVVRGTIASISDSTIVVTTATGPVSVAITKPLAVYARSAGTLRDVTPNSFVGVTSVPSPDGSQHATEIHIFPEALRGLGEGSRPMQPQGGQSSNMTNGTVSSSKMTNGTVGNSRMTNGTVATSAAASTIIVSYAGGSQTITVPAKVSVMKIAPTKQKLAAGTAVTVVAKKNSDGTLTTNAVMLTPAKR
jgi:hypothetical protein